MLESLLQLLNISVVNTIVLLTILTIFIFGLVFTKKNTQNEFVSFIPSLLTSIGIFGTFLGIVLGLLHFDQHDIEGSIPSLLEGLKTAFITSLAGIFSSLLFKTLSTFAFLKPKQEQDERYLVTPMDYLVAMQEQIEELKGLKQAMVADNEPSLSSQIHHLRRDLNASSQRAIKRSETQFKLQQQSFENLTQTLTETATKQAIETLQGVIADFNLSLTEQFGRNFKYFNEGLEKSILWQENSTLQFEQMQQLQTHAVEALVQSERAMTQIAEQSQNIPQTMQELKNIIDINQYQVEELERHLEAFEEMRERAIEAIPEVNQHLILTIDSLSSTVNSINEHHKQLLLDSEQHMKSQLASSHAFISDFSAETQAGIQHLQAANKTLATNMEQVKNSILYSSELLEKRLADVIQQAADYQMQQAKQIFTAMEEQIQQQAGFTASAVNSQLEIIDASMQREINQVISQMGQALNQISGQFVEDYSLLTESMKRIVNKQLND